VVRRPLSARTLGSIEIGIAIEIESMGLGHEKLDVYRL
jgi:hypothetical protein